MINPKKLLGKWWFRRNTDYASSMREVMTAMADASLFSPKTNWGTKDYSVFKDLASNFPQNTDSA
jgi:hypothetical protein